MNWTDFAAIFNSIEVCLKSMPTKRADFGDGVDDEADEDELDDEAAADEGKPNGANGIDEKKRQPLVYRLLNLNLPKAGRRLKHNDVVFNPVTPSPDQPYSQYHETHRRYTEACDKAEAKAGLAGARGRGRK